MPFYTCFSSHQLWAKQPVDPIGDFESNGIIFPGTKNVLLRIGSLGAPSASCSTEQALPCRGSILGLGQGKQCVNMDLSRVDNRKSGIMIIKGQPQIGAA